MEKNCASENLEESGRRKRSYHLAISSLKAKKQKLNDCHKVAVKNEYISVLLNQRDTDMPANVEYYVKNGIRYLKPYWSAYRAHAKGRWLGRKLVDVYANEFIFSAPNYIKAACKMGRIFVNGSPVNDMDYVIRESDIIYHICHRHEHPILAKPIRIIEETDDLLVVDKPPSMPVHACGRYKVHTVIGLLLLEQKKSGLRVLHRLDRTTSGLLLLAKNQRTDLEFKTTLKNGEWKKEYVCKVDGVFPDNEVVCDQPIGPLVLSMGIQCVREDGKKSKTRFQRVWTDGKTSVIKCFPETGRTHQIRVHLQYLGFPIVHDYYYNTSDWGPDKGKGAHYGKPFDELAKDISNAHSQSVWHHSVDPNYLERINRIAEEDVNLEEQLAKIRESDESYDEICFACHVKKKDPTLEQLALPLHCLKYETSAWSFSTDLPEWARKPDDKEGSLFVAS